MSYALQKYKGRSTKYPCPSCGRQRCFVLYVNEAGVALDPTVGRCDHQSTCGYHLKPREFFKLHPGVHVPDSWKAPAEIAPKKLWTIYKDEVRRFRSDQSVLMEFLLTHFDREKVYIAAAQYQLGALANGSTVFWQIDVNGKVRTGKVMAYGADGHRIKGEFDRVNWMHCLLKKDGLLPDEFELTQCLFGEHLLRIFPDRPVALVESEKTALICSINDPTRVWLATGGKYGLKSERMAPLKGRKVSIFPDADAYEEWAADAKELQRFYDVRVCNPGYTDEDIQAKRDLADLILLNQ